MSKLPDSLKTIDIKALLRKRGIYTEQALNQDMKEAARPVAEKLVKGRRRKTKAPQRHAQFTNEQIQEYWEKQIHIVNVLEEKFDVKVQQFVKAMVDGFLANLEAEIGATKKGIAKSYFTDNRDELLVRAELDFTPLLIDLAVLAGAEALKLIESKDIYTPFKLRETISVNVRKFTQSMLDTDRETLIDIITDGIKEGKSVPEIRGSIQANFENISKVQAQRITRTEVLRVSTQAAMDAWEQSGVVEGKQWVTYGAVDQCKAYEGQIAFLKDNFYQDTSPFKDGNPPLHPNCKCILLPINKK